MAKRLAGFQADVDITRRGRRCEGWEVRTGSVVMSDKGLAVTCAADVFDRGSTRAPRCS